MADTLRLVTIDDVGRARLLLDLNALGSLLRRRDTFRITAPPREDRTAQGSRRYSGDQGISTRYGNGAVSATFQVGGPNITATQAARMLERLLDLGDRARPDQPRYVEWGPEGVAQRAYFEIRGPATCQPAFSPRRWAGSATVDVDASWPVAPLGELLPMDLAEDWRAPSDDASGVINELADPSMRAFTGWQGQTDGAGMAVTSQADGRPGATLADCVQVGAVSGASYVAATEPANLHRVRPGQRVVCSAYVKPSNNAASAQAFAQYFDEALAYIGPGVGLDSPVANPLAGAWVRPLGQSVAPAGAAYVRVIAVAYFVPSGGYYARFDDAQLVIHDTYTIGTYFDGDTDLGRWEGDPTNSRSILLAESKMADYTIDQGVIAAGAYWIRQGSDPNEFGLTLLADSAIRFRHTARNYLIGDAAWTLCFKAPMPLSSTISMGAGRANLNNANDIMYARLDEDGTSRGLYLLSEINGAQVIYASAAPAALAAGGKYAVRMTMNGGLARAELWAGNPRRGGKPLTVTAWYDVSSRVSPAQGIYHYRVQGAGAIPRTAKLLEAHEEPYTYPDVQAAPETLPLRGVPGTAPAKVSHRINWRGASGSALNFALVAWRARTKGRESNLAFNGGFSWLGASLASTFGWYTTTTGLGVNAGGSISVALTGGPGNDPRGLITATATLATGSAFRLYERFKRGRTYTVEVWAAVTSGTWEALAFLDGGAQVGASVALAGSTWKRYRYTFTASADRSLAEFVFRTSVAAVGTVFVARLRVWEGVDADAPSANSTDLGNGGLNAFGFIHAANFLKFGSETIVADTNNVGGVALRSPNIASAEYIVGVNWDTLRRALDEVGSTDLAVYLIAKASSTSGATSTIVRAATVDVSLATGTRENAGNAKAVTIPAAGTFVLGWRLGTLPLDKSRLTGQGFIDLTILRGAGASPLDLFGLVLVPLERSQSSPTGKTVDGTYPTALSWLSGLVEGKSFSHRGRGRNIVLNTGQTDAGTSIAGEPFEPEPGDNDVLYWVENIGIDEATGGAPGGGIGNYPTATKLDAVHFAVTPRIRLIPTG